MLLNDKELEQRLNASPPLVSDLDRSRPYTDSKSPIQAASIDLTMGKIFLPEVGAGELGGFNNPRAEFSLEPGHTAVVETAQRLQVPDDLAAIGFPPARVSSRALLTTNPGHIDPGYEGYLSFTVINMGRQAFPLKPDEAIVTLLFFTLDSPPDAPYHQRHGKPKDTAVTADRLSRLSADFLDVERRARAIASEEEAKSRRTVAWVGGLAAVATLLAGVFGIFLPTRNDVQQVREEVATLQGEAGVKDLEHRISVLERKVDHRHGH